MVKTKKRQGKKGVNKSQAIRDYLTKKPGAGPKEIKEGLGKRGIEVSDALVSQVKYNSGAPKKAKKEAPQKNGVAGSKATAAPRRGRPATSSNGFAIDSLVEAKALADRVGGIDKAKEALSMLEKLT